MIRPARETGGVRPEIIARVFEELALGGRAGSLPGEERETVEARLDAIVARLERLVAAAKHGEAATWLTRLLEGTEPGCLGEVSRETAGRIKAAVSAAARRCAPEQGRRLVSLVLAIDPEDARAHGLMGDLLAKAGDGEGARGYWERAKELAPDFADPLWGLARYYAERGMVAESVREYLAVIKRQPTPANYWRVNWVLQSLDLSRLDTPPERRARIALVSPFTVEPVTYYLRVKCLQCGILSEFHVSGYGQHIQPLLDGDSELYRFHPNLVFWMARLEHMVPELADPEREVGLDQLVARVLSEIGVLTEQFCRYSDSLLILHNFLVPAFTANGIVEERQPAGLRRAVREVNRALEDAYREHRQVFVLDYDHVVSCFGKLRYRDPKRFYLADMEWAEEFLPELAEQYMSYIKPTKGILRKCVVVDLDQTLWGGIVGENGFEGIQLDVNAPGKEFRDFQRLLLELHRRGVILAINSKNNFEDAIEVIRHHPYMVLREKHFAAMRINWNDKVENMKSIAQELNIGLDSMVFVDDSAVERLYMKRALPEVLTVDLPEDPALYRTALERLNDFSVLSLTEEDRKRGERYTAESARQRLRSQSVSLDEFLASLDMRVVIREADGFTTPRVAQLTNRTNQFNLTTRRYTEQEIVSLCRDPAVGVYTLQVSDVFGDSGIVGVAIARKRSEEWLWELDSFLMSCRVLGRRLETCFLHTLLRRARDAGMRLVRGEFIPTKKNEVAREFYREHGFKLVEEGRRSTTWEMELAGKEFELPASMIIRFE